MFAYCNNNPIISVDPTGAFSWVDIGNAVGGIVSGILAMLTDNYPSNDYPKPQDSSFGFAYKEGKNPYASGRFLYAEGSGFSFDKRNGISLFDFQMGLLETSFGNEYLNGSIANFGTVQATAKADWSGKPSAELSAVASLYSVDGECVIPLFFGDLKLSGVAHFGAIGLGGEFDFEDMSFGAETPLIPGIVIEWDMDFDFYSGT